MLEGFRDWWWWLLKLKPGLIVVLELRMLDAAQNRPE